MGAKEVIITDRRGVAAQDNPQNVVVTTFIGDGSTTAFTSGRVKCKGARMVSFLIWSPPGANQTTQSINAVNPRFINKDGATLGSTASNAGTVVSAPGAQTANIGVIYNVFPLGATNAFSDGRLACDEFGVQFTFAVAPALNAEFRVEAVIWWD